MVIYKIYSHTNNMETISIIVWIIAVVLILIGNIKGLDNRVPCFLAVLFGAGGLVCAIDEYNAMSISEPIATVFIIAMLVVMVWGLYLVLARYLKGNVRI